MKEFLQNYEKYIEIATNLIFVILSIMLFLKTKDTKYLIGVLEDMKNKEQTKGQTFDNCKQVYRLNKATNVLEPTDDYIDIQELVNSSLETALDRVLNRLMPTDTEEDVVRQSVDIMEDELDVMSNLIEKANQYKIDNNLDLNMSVNDVYLHMSNKAKFMCEQLEKIHNDNIKKQEIKKEILKNEDVQIKEKSE